MVNSDGRRIARFGSTALTFEVSGNKILDQSLVASDQYHTPLLSKIWDLRDRKICGQIHLKRVHLGDPPLAEKNFHFFSSFSLICICSWPFSWSRPSKTFDWWTEDTNANQWRYQCQPMPTEPWIEFKVADVPPCLASSSSLLKKILINVTNVLLGASQLGRVKPWWGSLLFSDVGWLVGRPGRRPWEIFQIGRNYIVRRLKNFPHLIVPILPGGSFSNHTFNGLLPFIWDEIVLFLHSPSPLHGWVQNLQSKLGAWLAKEWNTANCGSSPISFTSNFKSILFGMQVKFA